MVLSPESLSRKRTRLEDQLSDIQYIDCSTPDNIVSTTAVIHTLPDSPVMQEKQLFNESYQPKNKSPRNSDILDKRQSLNLETTSKTIIPKSFTEMDINRKYLGPNSILTTPTPGSPGYKQLGESSANTTPGFSPTYDSSPTESTFQSKNTFKESFKKSSTPNYENVLTTISITYKSPPRSAATSPVKSPITNLNSVYENVILSPEKVIVPTSTASLPVQEASQPSLSDNSEFLSIHSDERPKSLSAIEELNSSKVSTIKPNLSSSAICNTSEQLSLSSFNDQKTLSSNQSSDSNIQYTASISSAPYHYIENSERLSPTDLSLSEVVESSTENLTTSHTSLSFPISPSKNSLSPNVSPTAVYDCSSQDLLTPASPSENKNTSEGLSTENLDNLLIESSDWSQDRPASINLIDFSPVDPVVGNDIHSSPSRASFNNDKRKSDETESLDDNAIYQQVKYFRRSIHEVNALLDLENGLPTSQKDSECSENDYEDVTCKNIEAKEESSGNVEKCDSKEGKENFEQKNELLNENFDSLESENRHVYENIDSDSLHEENAYEDVELKSEKTETLADEIKKAQSMEQNAHVRDLASVFEEKGAAAAIAPVTNKRVTAHSEKTVLDLDIGKVNSNLTEESTNANGSSRCRKFYEKDSLPPCLRARNLKYQLKTRSLDEEEFSKEFEVNVAERRKSLDESAGYKTNSLPKTLNQPKSLPGNDSNVDSIHLAHSSENVNSSKEEEEQKKRERIERYKEERRRILQDKYR